MILNTSQRNNTLDLFKLLCKQTFEFETCASSRRMRIPRHLTSIFESRAEINGGCFEKSSNFQLVATSEECHSYKAAYYVL